VRIVLSDLLVKSARAHLKSARGTTK
jgi:hypothetical protein